MDISLTVRISEENIAKLVEASIAADMESEHSTEIKREATWGVRAGVDKAVKDYIYSQKDRIIDRVVERATVEIVRKGIPKLIDAVKGAD